MRKFILSLAMTLCVAFVYGQTEQGVFFMSGATNLNFGSMKTYLQQDGKKVSDDQTLNKFSFTPSMGYFFNDNWSVGASLSYESETQKYDGQKYTASETLFGPFVRGYLGGENVRPFIQGDILFGKTKNFDEFGDEYELNAEGWDIGGGIAAFVGKNVSFDFALAYGKVAYFTPGDEKTRVVSAGLIFNVGISVYL